METLFGGSKVEAIRELLRYDGSNVVNNEGHSGGLLMLWQDQNWAHVLSSSQNHMDLVVEYYGFPKRHRRWDAWCFLQSLAKASSLPWCCIGDYNDLLAQEEKRGRCVQPNWSIQCFREATEVCGLLDLGMIGY